VPEFRHSICSWQAPSQCRSRPSRTVERLAIAAARQAKRHRPQADIAAAKWDMDEDDFRQCTLQEEGEAPIRRE